MYSGRQHLQQTRNRYPTPGKSETLTVFRSATGQFYGLRGQMELGFRGRFP